jgi:putative ABC transport system permease protein
MISSDIKLAVASLRSTRWRSVLTMLGIIIGIVSVVTTVSLGEGVKRQVAGQINTMGKDIMIVRSGIQADSPRIGSSSLFSNISTSALSESDVSVLSQVPNVQAVVPLGVASGIAEVDGQSLPGSNIIATSSRFPEAINHNVEFGGYFSAGEETRHVVVVGKRVAEQLFKENVPIGRTLRIRGQDFIVRGVFEEFSTDVLQATDFNRAVFIPYPVAKELANGPVPISNIIIKASSNAVVSQVSSDANARLKNSHAGQQDFTIITQKDNLVYAGKTVDLITQLVSAIAGISLLVGGIGIMNIMLVSVSERTREIGIRKAIGATNRQILDQFLIEAAVLSFVGGIIGIVVAVLVNFGIRIFTSMHPVITIQIVIIATGVSWIVGIIFGVAPAVKAARKDPIDALRYE